MTSGRDDAAIAGILAASPATAPAPGPVGSSIVAPTATGALSTLTSQTSPAPVSAAAAAGARPSSALPAPPISGGSEAKDDSVVTALLQRSAAAGPAPTAKQDDTAVVGLLRGPESTGNRPQTDDSKMAAVLGRSPAPSVAPVGPPVQKDDDRALAGTLGRTAPSPATPAGYPAQKDDTAMAAVLGRSAPSPAPAGCPAQKDDTAMAAVLGRNLPPSPAPAGQSDDTTLAAVLGRSLPSPAAPAGSLAQKDDTAMAAVLARSGTAPAATTGTLEQRDDSAMVAMLARGHPSAVSGAGTLGQKDDAAMAAVLARTPAPPAQAGSGHQADDAALACLLSDEHQHISPDSSPSEQRDGIPRRQKLKDDAALAGYLGPATLANLPTHDDGALAKVIREGDALRRAQMADKGWMNSLSLWLCSVFPVEVVAGGRGRGGQLNQISFPCSVATSSGHPEEGSLLIADTGNRRVVRWHQRSREGEVVAGSWKAEPMCVINDGGGGLFVSVGRVVEHWTAAAEKGRIVATGCWPTGLARGKHGALLVADTLDHAVSVFWMQETDQRGRSRAQLLAGGISGRCLEQLHRPFAVVLEKSGTVLILDSANHRVVRWALTSAKRRQARDEMFWRPASVVAGGRGQGSHAGQLSYPRGLAIDASGAVLVSDTCNHRVMRWAPGADRGEVIAGGHGRGSRLGQLNHPTGLAVEADGSLLVADTGNHRILRYPRALAH